jgi:hypothetical protein
MSARRRPDEKRRRRGQALVEFALVSPLLFLLIVAIIETGRFVFYYHVVNEATREGARYAIVHGANAFDGCPSGPMPGGATNTCDPTAQNIKDFIIKAGEPALDPANLTFGWSGDGGVFPLYSPQPNNHPGNDVTIHVEYSYSPILLSDFFGTVSIDAEATLVINN